MTVQSGAPLDLATTLQEGLSVVDPAGPLARTWYFDGRFLRADGFRVDQAYERALAGFVARGAGTGVLHGLEVDLGTGDTLSVDAGLALSPSGRVVLLTRQVHLPTATLISRARGTLDPGVPSEATGHSTFAPCPPEVADDGVPVLPDTTLWVLTAAPTEALCGEEERFGQLCADACATETDRSQVVEGVLFRLRPVVLTLPTPQSVTMTAVHLRARVAAAWFAAERFATGSIVSGAGLRSPLWCRGAEAAGGEEVPLAVLHRQGAASVWVDGWTARRELLEPTPRRYWDARTARRPLSVAAAQLLQFQCQLGELDVADVSQVSGSALLDAGLVELPSAGYLAVNPAGDVGAQLRTRFGPGVDLRLCVGRADVVPELLEQARHRERISLTRGLDDSAKLERVDVLVPDGEIAATSASVDALVGESKVLPARRDGDTGSAMSLATMARDSSETGWTWAAVAAGQLPKRALPDPVVRFVRGQARRRRRVASVDAAVRDLISADRPAHVLLGRDVFGPGTRGGEGREIAVWAQIVSTKRVDTMGKGDVTDVRGRACYVAAVDDVSVFDARFTGEMRVVSRVLGEANGQPTVQLEAVLDGFVDAFTLDNGTPRSRVTPIRAMAVRWAFGTDEDGAERLAVALSQGSGPAAPTGLAFIATRVGTPQTIKAVLARIGLRREGLDLVVRPAPGGDRDEEGAGGEPGEAPATGWTSGLGGRFSRIFQRLAASGVLGGTGFTAIGPIGPIGPMPGLSPIATAEVTDTAGAATPGTPTREGADTAIELISAALAAQGRDPGFAVGARALLYGAATGQVPAVRATRDWVLFHRRREVTCPGPVVVEPTTRTLRLLHSTLDSEDRVKELIERLKGGEPLDDAGFASVVDVEFPENSAQIRSSVTALRLAWQATPRPPALRMLVAADGGDGPTVALARIDAVRSALTGLVDTPDAETGFLQAVPPEFAALGIDGVLLSAGVLATAQPTTCVRLLRLSRSDMARLRAVLRDLPSDPGLTLEELMARELVPVDPVSARFQGGTLGNASELKTWWESSEALQVIVVTPTDLGDGSDPLDARIGRAKEALAALGLEISSTLEVPVAMPPCGVTALVSVTPPLQQVETADGER